jgi:hypothetical protein
MHILEADTGAGSALHQYLVSGVDEFPNARGNQAYSILMYLDLFRHTDFHGTLR